MMSPYNPHSKTTQSPFQPRNGREQYQRYQPGPVVSFIRRSCCPLLGSGSGRDTAPAAQRPAPWIQRKQTSAQARQIQLTKFYATKLHLIWMFEAPRPPWTDGDTTMLTKWLMVWWCFLFFLIVLVSNGYRFSSSLFFLHCVHVLC
jgi:hypothetical protein